MDIFGIGSAIGGIASAVGSVNAQKQANAANLALAREQNDWNLAQWYRENEYNTTSNQLKRWMDAGLNPNSFAAQATPSLAATSPQSADLANQQPVDFGLFGQQIGNLLDYTLRQKQLTIANKRADAEIKHLGTQDKQITALTETLLPEQVEMTKEQRETLKKQREVMDGELSKVDAAINQMNAMANQMDAQGNNIREQTRFLRETWQDQKLGYKLRNYLMQAQTKLTLQEAENLVEQLQGIIIENGIKAKSFNFTDFEQWIKAVEGYGSFFEAYGNSQRKEAFGNLFNAISSFLSNPFSAGEVGNQRQQYWQGLFNRAPSWQMPQMVTP